MPTFKVYVRSHTAEQKAAMERGVNALVAWAGPRLVALVQEQIQAFGAIDTGNMLNSVHAEPFGNASTRVSVGAGYAGYVNYGTRFMAGRPFWDTALALFAPEFVAEVRKL